MKDVGREAKHEEFVRGQHPKYIDDLVWLCSKCGCLENIINSLYHMLHSLADGPGRQIRGIARKRRVGRSGCFA